MKIHNHGSDYAYQRELKKGTKGQHPSQLSVQSITKSIVDVENKLQTGRKADVEAVNESTPENTDTTNKTKKSRKKKKERADDGQQMPTEC